MYGMVCSLVQLLLLSLFPPSIHLATPMHSVLASCHLASICRMLHSNGSSSPDKARDVDNHLILRTAYATKQGNQATLGRTAVSFTGNVHVGRPEPGIHMHCNLAISFFHLRDTETLDTDAWQAACLILLTPG
ncbi:hypothetical protein CGGC5_v009148 [Colletotrichum fructicola Nara gc5]|uniref:Secreted protein n=1 Tax=Colletotrichum fructicola (strain Nara gc5) TaxID=1213859 RepID=A0A7J6J382_COLFN|nr:hypothetical protein CGGC5_v009148 [Colletotrichum fructicola Nara gc5]